MNRKYKQLWTYLRDNCLGNEVLTFDEIYNLTGHYVDSEFMDHRRDGLEYDITVTKIDMRSRTVLFSRSRRK